MDATTLFHEFRRRAALALLAAAALAALPRPCASSPLTDANDAYNAGNLKRAIKLYRQAAAGGESPALCYFNMANGFFQLDSMAQAIVYYQACIRNAPDFFKAHLNLAVCYYSLDDLGRCLASIRRALELDPLHQKSLLIQAATFRRCGATARAVASFENLARLYPQLEEPYIALGELYRDLEDDESAVSWLSACPPGTKNADYVNTLLAGLYEKKSDVPRAIYYLNQAFDADTTKRWTLYRIATLQRTAGNDLVAIETCRHGLDRFPDFADLAVLGGTIAFERGDIDAAERLFSRGAEHGSPAAVVGLSNVRNRRKAREE